MTTRGIPSSVHSPQERLFRPVDRPRSLARQVVSEIERLIAAGHLVPGQRLSAERELGARFGVSRTVIREAVHELSAKGLLEVKAGDGTYVAAFSHNHVSDALLRLLRTISSSEFGHRTIWEFRRPIEIEIAGLAAERATGEDIKRLGSSVDQLDDDELSRERFIHADVQFHLILADSSHNPFFPSVLRAVSDAMSAIREIGQTLPDARQHARREHRDILTYVAKHDVEGARDAMARHLITSEQIVAQAAAVIAQQTGRS